MVQLATQARNSFLAARRASQKPLIQPSVLSQLPARVPASYGLTEDQTKATELIFDHLRKGKSFILQGYAGTGKTKVTAAICTLLGSLDIPYCICAPTNKACKVIQEKNPELEPITVDRALRWRFHPGKQESITMEGRLVPSEGVLIVDEYSMLGEKYVQGLEKLGLPILYVGDPAQLPPVNDKDPELDSRLDWYELTEILRQDDTSLSQALRLGITDGIFPEEELQPVGEDPAVLAQKLDGVVLSYTNREVDRIARFMLGGRSDLQEGDPVVFNSPLVDKGYSISDESVITFRRDIKNACGPLNLMCANIQLEDDDTYYLMPIDGAAFRSKVKKLSSDMWKAKRDRDDKERTFHAAKVRFEDKRFKPSITSAQDKAKLDGLKEAFDKAEALLDELQKKLEASAKEYIDLRYSRSLTVHKSQGSTYDRPVVVNMNDILSCKDDDVTMRLLYVAGTRAVSTTIFA